MYGGESRNKQRSTSALGSLLIVLAGALCACTPPLPGHGGDMLPLALLFTSDLPERVSGDPDAFLVAGDTKRAETGALYVIQDGRAAPVSPSFLAAPVVSRVFRTGSYIAVTLASPVNYFGRACRTVLVHRFNLSLYCLETHANCPNARRLCPGYPVQSDANGTTVAVFDADTALVRRYVISAGTVASRIISRDASAFAMNDAGEILIRDSAGAFFIHQQDGAIVDGIEDANITCFFGGNTYSPESFYAQRGTQILKFSARDAKTPTAVWNGAPDFPCENGGGLTLSQGKASILYDPAVTTNIRLHFGLVNDTGQTQTVAHVGPPTIMAFHGGSNTVAFAGINVFAMRIVRVVGTGTQTILLSSDELHSFDVHGSGDVYYSASWPIDGLQVGVIPAGTTARTIISREIPWTVSFATIK